MRETLTEKGKQIEKCNLRNSDCILWSIPIPVKETEVNLFSTTENEKETLLAPLHPHSHSGLSPSSYLLFEGWEGEHKLE